MNRLNIFFVFLLLVTVTVMVIKSKWFDRAVDSLIKGTKSTTVGDLKKDASKLNANTQTIQETLDAETARIKREKAELNQL